MINNCIIIGRLTRDPELRKTQSNISVVNFTLAVNRNFKDESGEAQTDFITCIAWRQQAENLARYMKQGSLIGVEGRIQTGSYEGEHGTVYTTDVVANRIQFLETKRETQSNVGYTQQQHHVEEPQQGGAVYTEDIIKDSDLPF